MTADSIASTLIWAVLAFWLWLGLVECVRRLRLPGPVLVAASLSWIIARVFMWAIPVILHQMGLHFGS